MQGGNPFPLVILFLAWLAFTVGAVALAILAIVAWRRGERRQAKLMGIPSFGYLLVLAVLLAFLFRPGPRYTMTVDLRHPFDVSGMPPETYWYSRGGPTSHLPGSVGHKSGRLTVRVTLPNGTPLALEANDFSIDLDEQGIEIVNVRVHSTSPENVLNLIESQFDLLIASAKNSDMAEKNIPVIKSRLRSYRRGDELNESLSFIYSGYRVNAGVSSSDPDFRPVAGVRFGYSIYLDRPRPKKR